MKTVVLALLFKRGCVLTAWRKPEQDQGKHWEFPGGKLKASESSEDGLSREIDEEIGVKVEACERLLQYTYRYPENEILFDVYTITADVEQVYAKEGQFLRWYPINRLSFEDFPAANRAIINRLCLPQINIITPDWKTLLEVSQGVEALLKQKYTGLLSLRLPSLSSYTEALQNILPMIRASEMKLMVHNNIESFTAASTEAVGLHVSQAYLRKFNKRPVGESHLFAVSCHSLEEVKQAEQKEADFCVLSPIHAVKAPNQKALGLSGFADIANATSMPVFALGGMHTSDLPSVLECGGQGIAGIRCFQSNATANG